MTHGMEGVELPTKGERLVTLRMKVNIHLGGRREEFSPPSVVHHQKDAYGGRATKALVETARLESEREMR